MAKREVNCQEPESHSLSEITHIMNLIKIRSLSIGVHLSCGGLGLLVTLLICTWSNTGVLLSEEVSETFWKILGMTFFLVL